MGPTKKCSICIGSLPGSVKDSLVWSNGGLGGCCRENSRAFHRSRSYIQFNQSQTQEYRVEMYPGVICSVVHAATRCAFAISTLLPGSNLKNLAYEEGKKRGSLQLELSVDTTMIGAAVHLDG